MPVLETVKLIDLLDYKRQDLELVAWAQGQGDAYGCDKFVMLASILRQIYQRTHLGHGVSPEELGVAKDLLRNQDTDQDSVSLIARMALLAAPSEGDTDEERQASIADFATKHQRLLESLIDGHLTAEAADEAAKLTDGLLRLLQLRHKKCFKERFGTFLTTSLDEGGGKVHKWLKGDQQPDVMYSTLFSQIITDPSQILKEKMVEWTKIWKCDDDQARARACTVIRKTIVDALLVGDVDEASGDLRSGAAGQGCG